MSKEAMQMAFDMLNEIADDVYCDQKLEGVITALRQALVDVGDTSQKRVDEMVKTEHEPVLWLKTWSDGSVSVLKTKSHAFSDHELEPLYTSPPKREWVGLTDREIQIVASKKWWSWEDAFDIEGFSRAIERVLKEKNHG